MRRQNDPTQQPYSETTRWDHEDVILKNAGRLGNVEEYLILSMEIPSDPKEIKDTVFPDEFIVDYVRVYKKKTGAP